VGDGERDRDPLCITEGVTMLHRPWLVSICVLGLCTPAAASNRHSNASVTPEMEQLPQVIAAIERGDFGTTPEDKAMALRGAANFFSPYPGGNGRACATCHSPQDGYSLSPETVEERWQRMQAARRSNPGADDALFRAIDADDGATDFTMLRQRALVKVRVPLPARVRLIEPAPARVATFWRAVPALSGLEHTAPYQQDRSVLTLEDQIRAALRAHMQATDPAPEEFVASVAHFERGLFANSAARRVAAALKAGAAVPDVDPPLSALELHGKERFEFFCGRCHGGAAQVENRESRIFPPHDGSTNPHSINVGVSNPLPAGLTSDIHGPAFDLPTQRFSIDLPTGQAIELASSDPGTVLTDIEALETVAGNQVFNRFDIPQLRGINDTAPYFHDHRAATLEDVLKHYQRFFAFINQVRGLPLPIIPDEDVEPIVAYMRKAF
jgi:cytochrome c peroxidase